MLEDRHLTETTASAATREQNGAGGLCLDEDGAAHLDAAAELASRMAEEPVLRDRESAALSVKMLNGTANQPSHSTYPGCVRKVSIKNRVFQSEIAP